MTDRITRRRRSSRPGEQLRDGRHAIVLTVWQPYSGSGFIAAPIPPEIEDDQEKAARRVADQGARLARKAGFKAERLVERGGPVWERIVEVAEERDAGILVVGSHGRTGVQRVLLGSVAAAAASHTDRPVLIAHLRPGSLGYGQPGERCRGAARGEPATAASSSVYAWGDRW